MRSRSTTEAPRAEGQRTRRVPTSTGRRHRGRRGEADGWRDGGGSPARAASPAASPNPAPAKPKARLSIGKDAGGRGSRSVDQELNLSCGDKRGRAEKSSGGGGTTVAARGPSPPPQAEVVIATGRGELLVGGRSVVRTIASLPPLSRREGSRLSWILVTKLD
jgi:hypothetical protein